MIPQLYHVKSEVGGGRIRARFGSLELSNFKENLLKYWYENYQTCLNG